MKFVPLIFVYLLVFSGASFATETTHMVVVTEFIRELGETKNSQDIATGDFAEADKLDGSEKNQRVMIDAIRNGTRSKLKLWTNINTLKGMKLNKPEEMLIPYLINFNEEKLKRYEELIEVAKTFLAGPKPDIDYSKLLARMPEITAEMEYVDESIFQSTPLIFTLLIDQKPDSKNHLTHLIITKKQGQELIESLNNWFGTSMEDKKRNSTVSSASLLKLFLTKKGYRFSDEPWE